jgi:putative MATE family efflux protein
MFRAVDGGRTSGGQSGAEASARATPLASPALDPESLDPSLELGLPVGPGRRRAAAHRTPGLSADGRLLAGRLAGLTMRRAIWVLSWPIFAQAFLQSMVGLVDTVLAAAVSEAAADAIGGAAYIMWFIGVVVMAIGVGATALISRAVGSRRLAVANAALGQTVLLAVAAGAAVGVVVAGIAGPAASLMGLAGEAREGFRIYLLINAASAPLIALLSAGIEGARAAGDSLRPLRSMVVVNLVNIAASWVLAGVDLTATRIVDGQALTRVVLHNPFPFHLGVTGIALGTLLAHAVGAVIILRLLARGTSGLRLRRRRLRPHWHTMRRLLRIGLPNFLETLGMWLGNLPIVLMVAWLGRQSPQGGGLLGAHVIAIRVEAFSFLPGLAMAAAAATLAGQYLGAGSPAHARRAIAWCTVIASAFMGAMGVLFVLAPRSIVGLMTSQPAHLDAAPALLLITGTVQVPFAISIVLRGAMRGAGDVRAVMIITWVTTYAIRLPLAYALSGADIPLPPSLNAGQPGGVIHNPFWRDGGLAGLWIGLCIEVVIRAALFTWRFLRGGWAASRV